MTIASFSFSHLSHTVLRVKFNLHMETCGYDTVPILDLFSFLKFVVQIYPVKILTSILGIWASKKQTCIIIVESINSDLHVSLFPIPTNITMKNHKLRLF